MKSVGALVSTTGVVVSVVVGCASSAKTDVEVIKAPAKSNEAKTFDFVVFYLEKLPFSFESNILNL